MLVSVESIIRRNRFGFDEAEKMKYYWATAIRPTKYKFGDKGRAVEIGCIERSVIF